MNVGDAVPVLRIASSTSHPSRHEQSRHDEGCEHDDVEIGDEINCPAKRESLITDSKLLYSVVVGIIIVLTPLGHGGTHMVRCTRNQLLTPLGHGGTHMVRCTRLA